MKYAVRRFKNLSLCLKELEPFVRNGQHLLTGKPFKRFGGMRSRELLANWLICAAVNSEHRDERYSFTTDPTGSDGVIVDSVTQATWPIEHILVPRRRQKSSTTMTDHIEERILQAIATKMRKGGAAYARGKHLVVFIDAEGGPWHPNKIARLLTEPVYFDEVWAAGLQVVDDGEYVYGVAKLKSQTGGGNAPTWLVRIENDFNGWNVQRVQ